MSLYADYVNERSGWNVIENEDGFVVWHQEKEIFVIEELYIRREKRIEGLGSSLVNQVEDIAWAKGAKWLLGTIWTNNKEATTTLLSAISTGWQIDSSLEFRISMKKSVCQRGDIA